MKPYHFDIEDQDQLDHYNERQKWRIECSQPANENNDDKNFVHKTISHKHSYQSKNNIKSNDIFNNKTPTDYWYFT